MAALLIILKVLMIIAIVAVSLFVLLFLVYFFNLDMKLTSALAPLLEKWYDKQEAKREKKL